MTYREGQQRVADWEAPETLPTAAKSEVLAGRSILQVHYKLQLAQSGREPLCSEKRHLFDCWESTGCPGLRAEGRQEVVPRILCSQAPQAALNAPLNAASPAKVGLTSKGQGAR
jgi:hypothetical protein